MRWGCELGADLDPFDLICHIAFDQSPLTRRKRAGKIKRDDLFAKVDPQARAVLEALLDEYKAEGLVDALENARELPIPPINTQGTPVQLVQAFGGKARFEDAVYRLQDALYQNAV